MSEYLSKEEIKQWRSSLEKITLEEFAARLGKKVEEKKETNDLIDIVLHGKPVISEETDWSSPKVERLSAIAERAYEKEKELYISPFSAQNLKTEADIPKEKEPKKAKTPVTHKKEKAVEKRVVKDTVKQEKKTSRNTKNSVKMEQITKEIVNNKTGNELRDEVRVVLKKSLTEREQKVFDYFTANKNKVVYAKDLANLLELPRDYIYKYIKNLRAKIDGDALKNADKGGFILTI